MVRLANAAHTLHKMNPVRQFFNQVSSMKYQARLMTTVQRTKDPRFFRLSHPLLNAEAT
jgi:hypothetical protein